MLKVWILGTIEGIPVNMVHVTKINLSFMNKVYIKSGLIFLFVLLLSCFTSFAQVNIDTVYITYAGGEKETTKNKATYFRVRKYVDTLYADEYRTKDSSLANSGHFKSFNPSVRGGFCIAYSDSGYMSVRGQYLDNKRTGEWINYNANGNVWYTLNYVEDKKNGSLISYYKTGEVKRRCEYIDNELKSGTCFTRTGADTTYYDLYVYPAFPEGNDQMVKFIQKHLKYPKEAMEHQLEGKVYVMFTVKNDGTLENVHIDPERNSYYILNNAAIDCVKQMPRWNPGFVDGIRKDYMWSIPIKFKL